MNKYYTIFVDGELWRNIIDDMHSESSWGEGSIIFTNGIDSVYDFISNLRKWNEWRNSTIEIKGVYIKDLIHDN
jgi:hypothetical protein